MGIALQSASDCGGNTGPYRRSYSKEGFSAMSATVYLPSIANGEILYGREGDQAYVYCGGWGSRGSAVDAGFLHDYGADQWSAFMKLQGGGMIVLSPDLRFVAGSVVSFSFEAREDGQFVLTATGPRVDGSPDPVVVTQPLLDDWDSGGAGQVLKRMTSIAQWPESATGSKITGVRWTNARIGLSPASLQPWLSAHSGGHCRHPNDPAVVQVDFIDEANETVSIVLP